MWPFAMNRFISSASPTVLNNLIAINIHLLSLSSCLLENNTFLDVKVVNMVLCQVPLY